MQAFDLSVRPAPRATCRVRVGAGALGTLVEELVREPLGRLLVVVSDDRVGPLHAQPLVERLTARGLGAESLTIPRGEAGKSRRAKAWVEDRLLDLGAGGDTALVAVGGGAVGDLTGFVAATWHRGIPVVQVPTTLLAMADAALGGKTAVNLPGAKNLVGCFHQPRGVYVDPALLETLPERHYREGFAEVVKCAAVADERFFGWLELAVGPLRERAAEPLERAVLRCLRIKAAIVRRDERERGRRAMLNFGHTVGHALEAVSRHRTRHGRAVAVGLCVEGRLAHGVTGFPLRDLERLERLLAAFGLPVRPPPGSDPVPLLAAARRDKKNRDGRIRCALPLRLGQMPAGQEVTVAVDEARLVRALREACAGRRPAD